MSRLRRHASYCVHCGRSCVQEPCAGAREDEAKRAARAKPLPPIVCVKCGRPGCWADRGGCPAEKKETTG